MYWRQTHESQAQSRRPYCERIPDETCVAGVTNAVLSNRGLSLSTAAWLTVQSWGNVGEH